MTTPRPLSAPERAATFLLPPTQPIAIVVVGCGGTGGYVAQGLARLMVENKRRGGPHLVLMLIDGDVVEPANCGRQLFAPAEVGRNKAQTLAARLATVWGLPVTAVPQMASAALLHTLSTGAPTHLKLLIGCVDNAEARRSIAATLPRWVVTIDCGNAEHTGQVAVGTTSDPHRLRGALALRSVAAALPSPYLVYPNLLEDPAIPQRADDDCAVAVQDNRQGLNVNQVVADIAVEYATRLVLDRRITTFRTVVDLEALSMRSWPITPSALATATGLPAALFLGPADPPPPAWWNAPALAAALETEEDDA